MNTNTFTRLKQKEVLRDRNFTRDPYLFGVYCLYKVKYEWNKFQPVDAIDEKEEVKKALEKLAKLNYIIYDDEMVEITESKREIEGLKEKRSEAGRKGGRGNKAGQRKPKVEVIQKAEVEEVQEVKVEKQENLPAKKNKKKEYPEEAIHTTIECLKFFDEGLHPTTDSEKWGWVDTVDKLHRIDGLEYLSIIEIVRYGREDDFWHENFLSINKLRKKDKNKTPYWKRFLYSIQKGGRKTGDDDTMKKIMEQLENL